MDGISLTGGEPLLHPGLPEFVDAFVSKNHNMAYVTLSTSGINPDADETFKERYYHDLETLVQKDSVYKNMVFVIEFSYSDGVKPRERLMDFLSKIKELKDKHGRFPLREIIIMSKSDNISKLEQEVQETYKAVFHRENDSPPTYCKVYASGREAIREIKSEKRCVLKKGINSLFIRSNGNLDICCTFESAIIPLIPYANIYEHSIEEILDRRKVYLELLKNFQNQRRNTDSCQVCVNPRGFNDFLKDKLEELTSPGKVKSFCRNIKEITSFC